MGRLNILVVDDEMAMRESIAAWLREYGHRAGKADSGAAALERLRAEPFDLALVDIKMPGMDGLELLEHIRREHPEVMVVMITAFGTIESAVTAMKNGAHDYLLKPFDPQHLILLLEKIEKQQRLMEHNQVLKESLARGDCQGYQDMVAGSPAMLAVFDMVEQVAASDAPVLILGETGTGKELAARAIHNRSERAFSHFVPMNCGAQAEQLLESELFGHERGAFTGAVKARRGRLEMADGGTLFLDEVGDIPMKMQVDLLRVLEDGHFQRVGGNQNLKSDFRLISATHRNLPELCRKGLFRQDFYYRINVVTLEIPPLRERLGDVRHLSEHFLGIFSRQTGKQFSGLERAALAALEKYPWPGNVRELRNVIERAVILAQGEWITRQDLKFVSAPAEEEAGPQTLAQVERKHIKRTLEACGGKIGKAADTLGINRSTLARKLERMDQD